MASSGRNLSESVVDLADRMAALSSNMVDDAFAAMPILSELNCPMENFEIDSNIRS